MRFFTWKRILLTLLIILLLAVVAFVVWANTPAAPMPQAETALQSDTNVSVTTQTGWIVFQPQSTAASTGFVFYPGGRVDPRAYAPYMHAIAGQGYLAVIVPMPLNLAIFGINRASDVIAAFPTIHHWAIGGHSLGGSMAARFVQSNPSAVEGLVFWASYPDIDLSDFDIQVVSIYGTLDGLAKAPVVTGAASLLPPDSTFVTIEGGNHGQFGWYGPQPGDNEATISRGSQQQQTIQATVELLAKLNGTDSTSS